MCFARSRGGSLRATGEGGARKAIPRGEFGISLVSKSVLGGAFI